MVQGGSVYIMTNTSNSVFYTGVTSSLIARVSQHKSGHYVNSFTSKYKCFKLVYHQFYPTIQDAISAEKQIKAGSRNKKLDLIKSINPEFVDLFDTLSF